MEEDTLAPPLPCVRAEGSQLLWVPTGHHLTTTLSRLSKPVFTLRPTRGRVLALTAQSRGARLRLGLGGVCTCQGPCPLPNASRVMGATQPLPCCCHPHELHRRRRNRGGRRGFLWENPGLAVQSSDKPLLNIWPVPGRGGSASCSPHLPRARSGSSHSSKKARSSRLLVGLAWGPICREPLVLGQWPAATFVSLFAPAEQPRVEAPWSSGLPRITDLGCGVDPRLGAPAAATIQASASCLCSSRSQ